MQKYNSLIDSFKRTGQDGKLIPWFIKEVKARPGNEYALKALGSLCFEKNDLANGEKYYREALKINPLCARCYMSLGIACAMKQDNKQALDDLNKAVACDPGDAYIYSVRANLNEVMGNKQEALFDFNMAIYIDSRSADYYIQRASFNSKEGYFYLALSDLDIAAQLAPSSYLVFFTRADIYFRKKMFKEALDDINKAIALDSTHAVLYAARADFEAEISDFKKAVDDYDKATIVDPTDFHNFFNRAFCQYALEDMDAYCTSLHKCYQVLMQYAPSDSMKGKLEASMAIYCDTAKENYYYHRGIALYNLHRYADAAAIYSEAIRKFPGNSLIYTFRANSYLELKDYPHAIADYNASVSNKDNIATDLRETDVHAIAPDIYIQGVFASTNLSLAQCQFALGNYEEALNDINNGIKMAPQISGFGKENYYDMRGVILLTMGRPEGAAADFDTCLELNPAFENAWINRAVARVSGNNKTRLAGFSLKSDINNLAVNVNWALPDNKVKRGNTEVYISAFEDCTKATQLDPGDGYAWYVRGRLGKLLGYGNYCLDLLKAKSIGFSVEPEYMEGCKE